jgi:multidrug efflux pump subunit AcrA (membrane-fusion protein)
MYRVPWFSIAVRPTALGWLRFGIFVTLGLAGCSKAANRDVKSVAEPPTVRLVQPSVRTIVRVVEQPSFVQAYEHTAIYAKLTSYIEKWIVDIGDKVKKGDVLATLFMPELLEEYQTKKADVVLDKELILRAQKLDDVARADVDAAQARLAEAQSILGKFQAEVDRWDSEVKRLAAEVEKRVVAPQILLESKNQLQSSTAAREAAKAAIKTAQADLLSKQSELAKATVDVSVARARLVVAESDEKRVGALVGYLTLTAPFDGVIVARNANTGDFLVRATGDPSARDLSPYQSPDHAAPVYVVDRTDVVRVFVDIPEQDADHVRIGTKATVLVRAYRDHEIPAEVTRTSWAVNVTSRTLRAEIDLPNPESRILPGMYAYGKVKIERPDVRALPLDALVYNGEQTYYWQYREGHAARTEVETGISDGTWIEVTNRRTPSRSDSSDRESWTPIDGSEHAILGDLSILTEGTPVRVLTEGSETKVAGELSPITPADSIARGPAASP